MRVLIRKATIYDARSVYHLKEVDILLIDGRIERIEQDLVDEYASVIDGEQLVVTNGFVDTFASFRDPGLEHQEDLQSGLTAAARGGFTHVCVQPDTFPVTQTKSGVVYWLNKSKSALTELLPAAALTVDLKGIDLTEMIDLHQAGAAVFSNANNPVMDAGTQMRALQYIKHFDGTMYSLPVDLNIAKNGIVNEGIQSTKLGLKGIPDMAEELMVIRDITLVEYTDSKLHFCKISTAGSVKLIREAKKRGLKVSCGVSVNHIALTDEVLPSFDTATKIFPPLRDKADQQALIEGVKDGTIDVICSDHQPEDLETKFKEFDLANFGAIGLETAVAVVLTAMGKKSNLEQIFTSFNTRPAQILGLQLPVIEVGASVDLTVIDLKAKWRPIADDFSSKSKNSPYLNKDLIGKVIFTARGEKLFWNQ